MVVINEKMAAKKAEKAELLAKANKEEQKLTKPVKSAATKTEKPKISTTT